MKIEISKLTPHHYNHWIYGTDDNSDLIERIKASGWIKPILITHDNKIISGHRRVAVCIALGIEEIEFEYTPDDYVKQLELFVGENCYRQKSTLQKTQEARVYLEIEQKKAYNRMMHEQEPVETFPQAGVAENKQGDNVNGRTRDIVGEKVGLSGRSLDKAQKVVAKMDTTYDETFVEFFKDTLNENIDAAVKLVTKPDEIIQEIIDRTNGDPKLVSSVLRELERAEIQSTTPLPPGKYQILLVDFTNTVDFSVYNTTISEICEPDCILLTWVLPHQVETGIEIGKKWGFRYGTCLLWQRDTENEVSGLGEICLIMVKGSPNFIFKFPPRATEKPDLLKEIIDTGYPGWSCVEIFKDDGWEIW